ncbi:PASTA domain-containing protein [Streptomyces sp. CA-210063]|uniref:DUF6777 domain-containing protein n=1 Tax=Streptomyces sp. CA-210063 TaxID=2801029 RepID=UPI00214AB07A|nr:DUF6777 domain-containing protein [Streptomyces sp. CA-210063]UUU30731.1 PASTA domain-containing protein [Streptomyces sp. CA-210063]
MARAERGFRMSGRRGAVKSRRRGTRTFTLRTAGAFVAFAVLLGSMTGLACVARTAAAEAVGYLAENAFFTGELGDGRDLDGNLSDQGGSRKGDERGLYGGSTEIDVCDPELLLQFLLEAGNGRKKTAWAKALGIGAKNKNVREYVKSLTPFVLANDTLVANHGYKKGEANRYDAVLEAGTAVLVDVFGVPRVKCNCGNPLGISAYDPDEIKVEFDNKGKGNKPWKVKKDQVVRVEQADAPQRELTVADVEDPTEEVRVPLPEEPELTSGDDSGNADSGNGESESPAEVTIPETRGRSVEEVTQELEGAGLVVTTETVDDPDVSPGTVAGTRPEGGTTVAVGDSVTLLVAEETTPEQVTVPDVVGRPQAEAEAEITAVGLVPVVEPEAVSSPDQVGVVIRQTPVGLSEAGPQSAVTLVVGTDPSAGEDVGGTDIGGTGEVTDGGTGTDGGGTSADGGFFGGTG